MDVSMLLTGACRPALASLGAMLYKVMSLSKLALRAHGSNMPELGPHHAGA